MPTFRKPSRATVAHLCGNVTTNLSEGCHELRRAATLVDVRWVWQTSPRKWIAWLSVAVAYLLVFAPSTYRAVQVLRGRYSGQPPDSWTDSLAGTVINLYPAMIIMGAIGVLWLFRFRPARTGLRISRSLSEVHTNLWMMFAAMFAPFVCFGIAATVLHSSPEYPGISHISWYELLPDGTTSLLAGFQEEILVLAFPIVLLRITGVRWRRIGAYCVAARVSFHIYYGWTAAFLALWAITMVYLFAHYRGLLGLIVGHSLYDTLGTVLNAFRYHGMMSDTTVGYVILSEFGVVLLAACIMSLIINRRHKHVERALQRVSARLPERNETMSSHTS